MTFHATLDPDVIAAGDELTLEFNSSGPHKDVEEAYVRIYEIAPGDVFEKPTQEKKLVVSAYGRITGNEFVTMPTKDGKPTVVVPFLKESQVYFDLRVNPTTVIRLTLEKLEVEHAIHELRLEVYFPKEKKSKDNPFVSKKIVYLRSFFHFQLRGIARPVIAFIATKDVDAFFQSAEAYWKKHADIVVAKPSMSMFEILNILTDAAKKYEPWGRIIIVTHGRSKELYMKVKKKSKQVKMHFDLIKSEIMDEAPPGAGGVDDETEIVFGACKTGREQPITDAVRQEFFPLAKSVKIPRFLVKYSAVGRESFVEEIEFDVPGHAEPTDVNLIEARKLEAFNALKKESPGLSPNADPKKELPTFIKDTSWRQTFAGTARLTERKTVHADGKQLTNEELADVIRQEWKDPQKFHEQSESWHTNHDRWEITVISKSLDDYPDPAPLWFEVSGSGVTAKPKFKVLGSGKVELGGEQETGRWHVQKADMAPRHTLVEISSDMKQVTVTDLSDINTTVKTGGTTSTLKKQYVTISLWNNDTPVPCTVTMAKAELLIRPEKHFLVKFDAKRIFLKWRRAMRAYDPTKDYSARDVVVPKLSNPVHYGKSP